jgi:hypothetical protein
MTTSEKIQTLKGFITRKAFSYNWNNASVREMADEAETVIALVAKHNLGFASEIATTVEKFKKISEKQAYWIAKAAVEASLDSRVDFIYE